MAHQRKIISVHIEQVPNDHWSQCHFMMWALCDDGSLWFRRDNDGQWLMEPSVPGAPLTMEGANLQPATAPAQNSVVPASVDYRDDMFMRQDDEVVYGR